MRYKYDRQYSLSHTNGGESYIQSQKGQLTANKCSLITGRAMAESPESNSMTKANQKM